MDSVKVWYSSYKKGGTYPRKVAEFIRMRNMQARLQRGFVKSVKALRGSGSLPTHLHGPFGIGGVCRLLFVHIRAGFALAH